MKTINYKKLVAPFEEESLTKLREYVNINSVYDASSVSEENPYGKGVSNALKYIENLAKADGFNVKNINNRLVEISFGDIHKNNIGIFAHADVVPATGDWLTPPFAADLREGKLFARGTSDDKGPGLASYYAFKALRDNNLIENYSVRLVIGGDEERGSSCMHYYFHNYKAPAPVYGFTPDAAFPLIYGEKAITNYKASKVVNLAPIFSFKGGEVANSVIDKLDVLLPKDIALLEYLTSHKVAFSLLSETEQVMEIRFLGKSAHGSMPELGSNAAILGFKHLGAFYHLDVLTNIAKHYADPSGKTMDAFVVSSLLGETTYNMGICSYSNGVLTFVINFRHPETVELDGHIARISKTTNMEINVLSKSKYLLFDPESEFIKTLMAAYYDETGDLDAKPLFIGGGTYAKECPNTVAFGSAFIGREGDIHSPNEYIVIDDYYTQMAIYARAIHYLGLKACE